MDVKLVTSTLRIEQRFRIFGTEKDEVN